jgi:2-amino-4-hydroxy-6-hydroxymethyldihydropteridine diphosphokinase
MTKIYAGLGSNLGNREANLVRAIARIDACEDICVKGKSGFYETKPVGGPSQPDYLNCAIVLDTEIEPHALLKEFKKIETELGRKPGIRWGPRIIDLDILLYGDRVVNDHNLKIPHESMQKRIFVLESLCEISPDIRHPVLRRNISELLKELK